MRLKMPFLSNFDPSKRGALQWCGAKDFLEVKIYISNDFQVTPLICWSTTPRIGGEEAHLISKFLYGKGPQQDPKSSSTLVNKRKKSQ